MKGFTRHGVRLLLLAILAMSLSACPGRLTTIDYHGNKEVSYPRYCEVIGENMYCTDGSARVMTSKVAIFESGLYHSGAQIEYDGLLP